MNKEIEFVIDNKSVKVVSDCIDLNRHIAIIGQVGCGKTILVNKMIEEILKNDNETQVYILSESEFEYNFDNKRVKTSTNNIEEALAILRKVNYENYVQKTIVIDNVKRFMLEDYSRKEEIEMLILNLLQIERMKNVNLILTYIDKEEISDYILSNVAIKLISENRIGVFNTRERIEGVFL